MLNPKRKQDRAAMVVQLGVLAGETGAVMDLTAEGSSPYYRRGFHADLYAAPLHVMLSVHGDGGNERDNVYIASWYLDSHNGERLSSAFESTVGSVNRYYRHKATTVCTGFEALLLILQSGLEMVAEGTAFETVKETA